MPDKDLTIKVSTIADNTGAKEASKSLDKVVTSADQVTASTGATAKATKKLEEAHDDAGKKAEHSHGSHRALNGILRLLGKETVPELGHALHSLEFGGLGGVLAIGFAAEFIAKQFEAAAEAAAKLREAQSELKTVTWEAQIEANNKVIESHNKLIKSFEEVASAIDKLKQHESDELAVLEAKQKAQNKLLETQEKMEILAAGGDKAKEAEIHARYGVKKTDAAIGDEIKKAETEDRQRYDRILEGRRLKKQVEDDEAAYAAAEKSHSNVADAPELAAAKARQAELDKKEGAYDIPELQRQLGRASSGTGPAGVADLIGLNLAKQIKDGMEAATEANINRMDVQRLNKKVANDKARVDAAKERADKSRSDYSANQKAIDESGSRGAHADDIIRIHKQSAVDNYAAENPTKVEEARKQIIGQSQAANRSMKAIDGATQAVLEVAAGLAGISELPKRMAALERALKYAQKQMGSRPMGTP